MASVSTYGPHATKKKQGKPKVVLKRRYISDVVEVEEKPPPKPPIVHDTGVDEDVLSELSDAFELLYDPNYFGHLEFDEQLKKFKSRDLLEAKLYKTALKAFGNQRFVRERLAKDNGRKRVFVAQPLSELRGFDSFSSASCLGNEAGSARRSRAEDAGLDASSIAEEDPAAKEKSRYQTWLKQRKEQHQDLERMGDVERYLRGKGGQLSSMERSALRRFDESRRPKQVEQAVEEVSEVRVRPSSKVEVRRPSPLALFIVDNELRKRKLRLSDLFTSMDKDKNWLLTRDEFRKAMRQNRVPLPEPLLEDMVITLDQDNNNQLDYRELAQGLEQYRREKRTPQFLALLSEESNQFLLSRGSAAGAAADAGSQVSPGAAGGDSRDSSASATSAAEAVTAAAAAAASEAAAALRPGEFDSSQERYSVDNAEASAELRRRDQVALRNMSRGRSRHPEEFRSMVKTFDRDIDDHVALSSLPERPLAEMVDGFRQRQLREFVAIVDACKEQGVVFSERLYRRVFLYPADRPRKQIGKQIRPPGKGSSSSSSGGAGGASDELPLSVLLRPADRASMAAAARRGGGGGAGADAGGGGFPTMTTSPLAGGGARESSFSGAAWRGVRATSMARVGRGLPSRRDLLVDDEDAEQDLPTGAALVRSKVDCWLTFEDFQRLSAGLDYSRQARVRGPNPDAFWPGRLEGRVRRFLESGTPADSIHGPGVLFQPVPGAGGRRTLPYRAPRETWPVNNGHVTYGSIDPLLAHQMAATAAAGGAR